MKRFRYSSLLLFFLWTLTLSAQETTPEAELALGTTRTDEFGIEQVYVPSGCFMMGTSTADLEALKAENPPEWVVREFKYEQPQREVCITQGFWLDKYEVTHEAFAAFVADGGYTNLELWSERGQNWLNGRDTAKLPIECVADVAPEQPRVCITWYEAEAYAKWRGGSLPTEAQWEYAARSPESLVYPWGNEWNAEWTNVEGGTHPQPVGSFAEDVSWVGAMDMGGNAMEWVNDWLDLKYYEQAVRDDPTGPEKGRFKIEKGGWWGSNRYVARSASRYYEDPPSYQDHHIGVRVASPE